MCESELCSCAWTLAAQQLVRLFISKTTWLFSSGGWSSTSFSERFGTFTLGPSIDLRRKTDFRFAALYPADLAEPLISPEKVPSSLSVLRIIIRYVFPIQPGSSSGLNTNVSCDAVLGPFTAVVGSTKRMSTKSGFPGSGGRESKKEWTGQSPKLKLSSLCIYRVSNGCSLELSSGCSIVVSHAGFDVWVGYG
jgi:hypothetical protein